MPPVSIVICSIDPAKFQRVCDNYRWLYAGQPVEIIGIHDARSLAEGYNRGIKRATGELLILSHDDIEILNVDFAARVSGHLAGLDLIGVAGTTRLVEGSWIGAGDPHVFTLISFPSPEGSGFGTMLLGGGPLVVTGIQALDGVFMAMQPKVAAAISFDAVVFDDFHLYDLDFSFRAYRAGFRLGVCRDLVLIHESDGRHDSIWEEHKRRFEVKFREHLPESWMASQGANASFSAATRADIMRNCAPSQLARLAEQIGIANAKL